MWNELKENKIFGAVVSYGSLFTSFGTLLCCALPSTLVLLGMGATLANVLGEFPQLIWLSEHKGLVFGLSFLLLGLAFLGQKQVCAIDKREDCEKTKKWSRVILFVTLGINIVGASYAFLLPWFMN